MQHIRDIASGGFGVVSEVELDDGTRVAKKTFKPDSDSAQIFDIDSLKARFKREVRTQETLSGTFFIPVLASGLNAEPPWFTMPLASKTYRQQIGEDRIAGTPKLEPMLDILNSLEELHRLDYKHRDLKPENILLHDGRWKLADFGLVLPPTPESTALTRTNEWLGTLKYMAPEQQLEFHNSKATTDIYSFGCILHDLAVPGSRIPFQQQTAPGPLGPIIEKCTALDPTRRFQNIVTLRAALVHALSRGVTTVPDAHTVEWEQELKDLDRWDVNKARSFARFLSGRAELTLLKQLDEVALQKFSAIDDDAWDALAHIYCNWVSDESFDFEYCDVLIGRLEKIFRIGSRSLKTTAAIASAKLGSGHNRWYVMRRLLTLCGPTMDATVAERLSIEIIAQEAQRCFICCVIGITKSISDYHPLIHEVLKSSASFPSPLV